MKSVEIDDYALTALKKANVVIYPKEGDDLTLTVMMLIKEHEAFENIKKIVKAF
jgi:hypothetical protein